MRHYLANNSGPIDADDYSGKRDPVAEEEKADPNLDASTETAAE